MARPSKAAGKIKAKTGRHESASEGLSHSTELPRLKRVQGQLEGIEKMITERRYCIDIIHQIKAARSALRSLENSILKSHLKGCVRDTMTSKDGFKAEDKIQEIIELVDRL